MKTTLDLRDDLIARAKARAARESITLTQVIEEGLALRLRKTRRVSSVAVKDLPVSPRSGGLRPAVGFRRWRPRADRSAASTAEVPIGDCWSTDAHRGRRIVRSRGPGSRFGRGSPPRSGSAGRVVGRRTNRGPGCDRPVIFRRLAQLKDGRGVRPEPLVKTVSVDLENGTYEMTPLPTNVAAWAAR
jgi:hypothetical protein